MSTLSRALAAFTATREEEFFHAAFRKIQYESLDQLQRDLSRYPESYNRERAHQGRRTQERTHYQAFVEGGIRTSKEVLRQLTPMSKELTA